MPPLQRVWDHPLSRIATFLIVWILLFCAFIYAALSTAPKLFLHPGVRDTLSCGLEAAAAIAALLIMNLLFEHRSFSDYGFRFQGVVTETLGGYLIGFSIIALVISVLAAAGFYHVIGRDVTFRVWLPLLLYLFVAVSEETVFRGFIFGALERRYGTLTGLVITCVMFGMAHFVVRTPGLSMFQNICAALFIGAEAGLLLCAAFLTKRRLWLPIGIHWAWNFCQGPFFGTNVSGSADKPSYFVSHTAGPFFLSGGVFGPEASIVCLLVGVLAALGLLRISIRNKQWRLAPYPL